MNLRCAGRLTAYGSSCTVVMCSLETLSVSIIQLFYLTNIYCGFIHYSQEALPELVRQCCKLMMLGKFIKIQCTNWMQGESLWNVSKLPLHYTAQYPSRQPSSVQSLHKWTMFHTTNLCKCYTKYIFMQRIVFRLVANGTQVVVLSGWTCFSQLLFHFPTFLFYSFLSPFAFLPLYALQDSQLYFTPCLMWISSFYSCHCTT
jgi:hypothetical protein